MLQWTVICPVLFPTRVSCLKLILKSAMMWKFSVGVHLGVNAISTALYFKKCGMIKRVIKKRSKLFKKVLQCINKPYLVDDDSEVLMGFTRSSHSALTEDGKWLLRRSKIMHEHYKHTKKEEDRKVKKDRATSSVGTPEFFIEVCKNA